MQKITFLGLSILLLVSINLGLVEKSTAGAIITVGAEAGGPYTEFYKNKVKEFTTKTGIAVEFVEIPHENMYERFLTEAIAGTGAIDIYQADQPWISQFASKGFIEPLSNLINKDLLNDYFSSALFTVKYNNEIYALPYLVHTPIIYYRTDLFEKAGLKTPPRTLTEFCEYAKKLTDNKTGIWGTIVEGKQHPEPVTHFLDKMLQFGGSILDKNGNVVIDSPEVLKALKYMVTIQREDKSSPPGAIGYDCVDVHTLFIQGKVAMVSNWPYMYSMAKDPNQSKVVNKFDVALQPGNTSAIWSWGYSIASSSKKKEAAWKFIEWAVSTEVLKDLGIKFINPVPRRSALNAINKVVDLDPKDKKAISIMSQAVERGICVANFPEFPQIQNILSISLSSILSGQVSPEDELKSAAAQIRSIVKK